MDAQELIYMLEEAEFETEEEWRAFDKKMHEIFNGLPESEKEIIIDDNSFEPLSMIISAFDESKKE